jgi:hypothetical protein
MRFARSSIVALATALAATLVLVFPVAAQSADWQPGPSAILDNTYAGFIDVPANGATVPGSGSFTVAGWFVDRTAQGWAGFDDVHIYDGLAGPGGVFLGRGRVALSRPDVGQALGNGYWASSGFAAALPPGQLAPGQHTLTVYAHSASKGWWFTQVPVSVGQARAQAAPPVNAVVAPTGGEKISHTLDKYTIRGYALDPSAGSGTGIDRVQVYMDEPRGQGGTLIGGTEFGGSTPQAAAQYGPRFGEAGWRVDFKPIDFTAGNHHVYAYARSAVTGQETLAVASFDIFNP